MKATISKAFIFEAAHHLPQHDGKCRNLHGHSYRVTVVLHGPVNDYTGSSRGMVQDFALIGELFRHHVFDILDHTVLNSNIEYPTAENIALWIFEKLEKVLPDLHSIVVNETSDTSATISYEDLTQMRCLNQ